jgi:hypothetical protein
MQINVNDVNANSGYSNILENDRMFSPAPRYSLHPQLATVSTIQFSTTEDTERTKTAEANAGTTDARSGGVFAGPLTSELADGPSKTPLHSLRE